MAAKPTTNRRDFLKGRSAAEALSAAIDGVVGPPPDPRAPASGDSRAAGAAEPSPADEERYLVQYARPAMACQFAVLLNAGQFEQGAEAALAALDEVDAWEARLTVYRDSSDVMRINRLAADEEVAVEPRLLELLTLASRIAAETAGAFDATAGKLIKAWGFYKRLGRIPEGAELAEAQALVDYRAVLLDTARHTVRLGRAGIELNLGAIGKGFAVDRAADVLAAAGVGDFLIHGGQSSVLARGSRGGNRGWVIGVGDPLRPERRLAEVTLRDRALATSGATHQFFRHEGERYGHILDPRTGRPAQGVLSSTVVAPTAAEADALSTAFYTMGVAGAKAYCSEHPAVGSILIVPGKGGSSVDVVVAGLADEEWRLLS